ncbi:MAG TPA: M48 family metallopeptidase [Bryobacteraceae bacterium]|nr:M48 family metallopeptidase [Bryobacteraceae bacterium]
MRPLSAAILVASLAVLPASASDSKKPKDDPNQIGNRDVGKCLNMFSIEKEIALGKQLSEEVKRQAHLNDDPLISEYVNRVGQNLARNSDAKVPFTFQVIEDETPNAFALPGGFIFVNTGLIKIADEEDEFAAVLAHEIAHVAARHLTCQATKEQLLTMLALPAGAVLGGWGGVLARQGMGVGMPMAFMKFTRAHETEADYLGVQYMYAAGYDPNGAVSIFEKLEMLERQQPGTLSRLFAAHPLDSTRINNTQQEIQRILPSKAEYVVTTSEYHDIRERLITQDARPKSDKSGPTLRRAPGSGQGDPDGDQRPTIRRKDLTE